MDMNLTAEFNKQINREFYSAYLYYAMSNYFSQSTMDGFAKYMKKQALEELEHAQKFYDYMLVRRASIKFERVEAPDMLFANPLDVFSKALEHEKFITGEILKLSEQAKEIKDTATEIFLQGFITEQVEEEDKFAKMFDKIKFSEEDCGCFIQNLDAELDSE